MNNKWFQNPNTILLILILSLSFVFSLFIFYSLSIFLFFTYYLVVFLYTKNLIFQKGESDGNTTGKKILQLNPRLIRFGFILPLIYMLINNLTASFPLHFHYIILICYSFLPGIILLDFSGISKHFSLMENFLLSYVISYFCTAMLWSILLSLNYVVRTYILIYTYIAIGILNLIKNFNNQEIITYKPSFLSRKDGFLLALTGVFYILCNLVLYPELAVLLGSDISRHFEQSLYLLNSHNSYSYINYFFSNAYESAVIAQYTYDFPNSLTLFQSSHALLNILLPLAIYCLLKKYIEIYPIQNFKYIKKIPIVGTILWSLFSPSFSGFGVIYLFIQNLLFPSISLNELLAKSFLYTNYGSSYGFYGLTFLPLHTNILLIILLLWFILLKDLPKSIQFILFGLIYLSVFLTHLPEGIYFGLFLCFYYFISNSSQHIKRCIISGIISNILILLIYYGIAKSNFFQIGLFDMSFQSVCISLITFIGIFVLKSFKFVNTNLQKIKLFIEKKNLNHQVLPFILWFFSLSFVTWFFLLTSYNFSQIPEGTVPWYNYSLIGFPLLLSIFGYFECTRYTKKFEFNILVLFLLFTIIFGQLISLSKIYFLDLNYWEFRFGIFINISLCFFAAISLFGLYENLHLDKIPISQRKKNVYVLVLNFVFIIGFTSNLMSIETWYGYKESKSTNLYREMTFSNIELATLQDLKIRLLNDSNAWISTLDYSQSPLNLVGTKYTHVFGDYFALRSPELSFRSAYVGYPYTHPYIYMNYIRDSHVVSAEYFTKYYSLYLTEYVNYLPIVTKDSENAVYNGNKLSFPFSNSNISLVMPFDVQTDRFQRYFCPIFLSDGMINYSIYYLNDQNLYNSNTIILSFDPNTSESMSLLNQYAKENKTIIIFNTNGIQLLGEQLLDQSIIFENHTIDSISYPSKQRSLNKTFPFNTFSVKNNASKVSINYSIDGLFAPMLIETNFLNSTLFYCNIDPILTYLRSQNTPIPILDELRPICESLNLNRIDEKSVNVELFDYIKDFRFENATMTSNSVLFSPNSSFHLEISLKNSSKIEFNNVEFNSLGSNQKILQYNNPILEKDYSFYTKVTTSNPFLLKFDGNNEEISLSTNHTFNTEEISSIEITPNSTSFCLIRTPTVISNNVSFNIFQAYNQLSSYSYKNITIIGNTSFQIDISDYYFALSDFQFEGTIISDVIPSSYDQITPIKYGVISAIITSPVLLFGIKFFKKKKDEEKINEI